MSAAARPADRRPFSPDALQRGRTSSGAPTWPGGPVPALARGFNAREESVPGLEQMLAPGRVVVFAPPQDARAPEWGAACGKSQLAAYAARSALRAGGLDAVAWVTASSRATVLSGFAAAAARLGLDGGGDAEAAAAGFAAWLRSAERPWLVVLDDLRDPADLEGLWPAGDLGRLIITTGDPQTAAGRGSVVAVGAFTPREAVGYLSDRLSTDPDHRGGQLDLALELGGEPAALAHASAVIETSELTCREYHEIFRRQRAELERRTGKQIAAAAVTWMLSAEHADILEPGGGTWPLLVMAALLSGHGIPLAVLTAPAADRYLAGGGERSADAGRALAAARALGSAGLLDIDGTGDGAFARMSGALQASVRAAAPADLLRQAATAAADALLQAWPEDQPGTQPAILARSCADSVLQAAGDDLWADGRCHRVLLAAGRSLDAARLTGPAASWWQRVAAGSARLLGERHQDTVVAAGLLADALLAAGQAADAVSWSRWVLGARAETLGDDHRGTLAARSALGRALTAAGQPEQAVRVLEEAERHSERVFGPADEAALAAVEEHAAALLAAGQPAKAADLLSRALSRRERDHGRDDPAALATATRLADALLAAGQPREAIRRYEKVLARRERALGPGDPQALAARAALASALLSAGQIPAALQHYRQATDGYQRALGAAHPDTVRCAGELARAYYDAGQLGDAVTLLRAAITEAGNSRAGGGPAAQQLASLLSDITEDMTAW